MQTILGCMAGLLMDSRVALVIMITIGRRGSASLYANDSRKEARKNIMIINKYKEEKKKKM